MRKFAISDIHGCLDSFKALLQQIRLTKEDELYLLGDYIDRGPDSKGVIDYILHLQEEGFPVNCLRGNHEQMLLNGVAWGGSHATNWLVNGGYATMASFRQAEPRKIPVAYITFLESLPYYFQVDEYILVHAGLGFPDLDPLENPQPMLWARGWYDKIDRGWLGEKIIVHGHTPVPSGRIKKHLRELHLLPVVNIDNGCVFDRGHLHRLCAFELTERKLFFQQNVEGQAM